MATVKDPICGKEVDTLRARAVGIYGGVTFYFCSLECKAQYVDPRKTPRDDKTPAKTAVPSKLAAQPATPVIAKPVVAKPVVAKPVVAKPVVASKPAVESKPRTDPSLELPPMPAMESGGDDDPLPDLTPQKPHLAPSSSPSVIADVRHLKKSSRRWAFVIVILAALVVAAAVLSLRN